MNKVIIALDNFSKEDCDQYLNQFKKISPESKPLIKIGLELFCKHGPSIVTELHKKFGYDIFLDLKLHDIPNTVKKSVSSLANLPIKFLTIHLSGGLEMISAAVKEAKVSLPHTQLLGVSYLTSLGESDFNDILGVKKEQINEAFDRLFQLAFKSGIQGVVSSVEEVNQISKLEEKFQKKLIKVTPGIRFEDEIGNKNTQDQKRVATPKTAFEIGSDFIVMGRSLTTSGNLSQRIKQLETLLK